LFPRLRLLLCGVYETVHRPQRRLGHIR
jgi:hypothetical protein